MAGLQREIVAPTAVIFALTFTPNVVSALQVTPEVMEAACRSQNYLQMNGYLNPINSYDKSTLHIDIWERMNIDGSKDSIQQLLEERQGLYSNKLYGVNIGDKYNAAAYKFSLESEIDEAHYFNCVVMEKNGDWISLVHQNCEIKDITRIPESELDC
ncbi:hypothetical protein PUV54_10270 [Hyphococcus flavus]|uniref:Uncharacterized protein n=1 Tax=Hyphococcus flavus TaxID=1866326 RepID=A0AAF0CF15_9PROT|nr:hypothetical protein [Hyphococcus flavus]WDI30343.1 hypothetical protein PUV54_10270 [Hyphococcus flavus]